MKISRWQFKGLVSLFAISVSVLLARLLLRPENKLPELQKISIFADSTELQKIPKIGHKRAKAIHNYIHYWNALPDTYALADIYNIDSATVREIIEYIEIPETLIRPITRQNLLKLSEKELESTGLLPKFIAKNLVRKKNQISSWDDINKLYGSTLQLTSTLQKYFYLPETKTITETTKKIELNSATPEELEKLPGIGKILAQRIVKYRNLLGFYYSVEQLKEVYGLPQETFLKIRNKLYIKNPGTKTNINQADAYILMKHPYISKILAYRIVKYRKKYGNFKTIDNLKNIYGINDSLFNKLKYYFSVGD